MKIIYAKYGEEIFVDDEDFCWLNEFEWKILPNGYVYRSEYLGNRKCKTVYMHRQILGLTDRKVKGDHRNGVRHDNQRRNLRACTNVENTRNTSIRSHCKSGYKGVYKRKNYGFRNQWRAKIVLNGKTKHLGHFPTPEDASFAYDFAAIEHFGAFAKTNWHPTILEILRHT